VVQKIPAKKKIPKNSQTKKTFTGGGEEVICSRNLFKKMARKENTPAVDSAPAAANPTNPALMNAAQQAPFLAAQAMHLHQQRQVWLAAFGDQAALQASGGGGGKKSTGSARYFCFTRAHVFSGGSYYE